MLAVKELAVKDYVRDALLTAALFGSSDAACPPTPRADAVDTQSAQAPTVPLQPHQIGTLR
jgi:hypothetical protein